jgi:hypothetical protein
MASTFVPREPTAVYRRFVRAVQRVSPTFVVTTNFDELLEKHLPDASTVLGQDIERLPVMLSRDEPFVCKLHGTVSDLKSLLLTRTQYEAMEAQPAFLEHLGRLLSLSHVVFLGYGLQDQHVIGSLLRNERLRRALAEGPHFLVTPHEGVPAPKSVKRIRYTTEPSSDHRAALQVVEEIATAYMIVPAQAAPRTPPVSSAKRTRHLLFDLLPPGIWQTSQTAKADREDGSQIEMTVGVGLTTDEIGRVPTAMHDLLVGLVCFDEVYAPLSAMHRLLRLVGPKVFWALLEEEAVRFVWWDAQVGVIFSEGRVAGGDVGTFAILNPDKTERTLRQVLTDAGFRDEKHLQDVHARTTLIHHSEEGDLAGIVRGLLLRPSIRNLLGFGEGTSTNAFARWHMYPVLRLGNVVKVGTACRLLSIDSVKFDFGMAQLAGPALAASSDAAWTTDDAAGYVLGGRFAADLESSVRGAPGIIDAVLRFRKTAEAAELRAQLGERLHTDSGADIVAVMNGGLRAAIPTDVLERARSRFCQLLVGSAVTQPPVLWNDSECENSLRTWRRVNRRRLEEYCKAANIGPYDPCPCESGDKLKFCCAAPLRE